MCHCCCITPFHHYMGKWHLGGKRGSAVLYSAKELDQFALLLHFLTDLAHELTSCQGACQEQKVDCLCL